MILLQKHPATVFNTKQWLRVSVYFSFSVHAQYYSIEFTEGLCKTKLKLERKQKEGRGIEFP